MRQMLVRFEGDGSGVGELSWGQREILDAMRRQRTMMPLPFTEPLPPGTTLHDVADWLRYLMSRHQAMRTRLHRRPDGTWYQVVHSSGELAIDLVEAGDEDPAEVIDRHVTWRHRWVEEEYDLAGDWPVFVTVALVDGVPTYRNLTICHVAIDAFGAMALGADLSGWQAGRPGKLVTATSPLEQARWQGSPDGQRHNRTTLRYWEDLLRQVPARRFPTPVDRSEPRYWQTFLTSPATHLAVQRIRSRTGAGSAQVILTAFLMALARVTGINPSAARVAVNNRFRRGLADSVSIVIQYGPCLLDVAGSTFDEALARLSRRLVATLKNAYYDPWQLAELVDRIGRERGEDVDIECYYNDRRFAEDTDPSPESVPTAAQVHAARSLTSVSHAPLWRAAERLFVAVEAAPDTFRLLFDVDTDCLSLDATVRLGYALEEIAVEAALADEVSTRGLPDAAR